MREIEHDRQGRPLDLVRDFGNGWSLYHRPDRDNGEWQNFILIRDYRRMSERRDKEWFTIGWNGYRMARSAEMGYLELRHSSAPKLIFDTLKAWSVERTDFNPSQRGHQRG